MTFQQVEHLFGNPTRRASDMHDTSTTWYYGVRAIVFDSIKGTVRFWSVN
jgi:hypothetical protein